MTVKEKTKIYAIYRSIGFALALERQSAGLPSVSISKFQSRKIPTMKYVRGEYDEKKRRKVKEKERGEISEDDTINTTWISTTGYDDDEKRDTFEDRSRENTTLVARRRKDKESKKRRRKKRTTVGPCGASGGLSSLW